MKILKLFRVLEDYIEDKKFSMIYRNNRLNIINYSEIIDFSSKLISIRCDDRIYYIEGINLVISKMMENELLITGNIDLITFK